MRALYNGSSVSMDGNSVSGIGLADFVLVNPTNSFGLKAGTSLFLVSSSEAEEPSNSLLFILYSLLLILPDPKELGWIATEYL